MTGLTKFKKRKTVISFIQKLLEHKIYNFIFIVIIFIILLKYKKQKHKIFRNLKQLILKKPKTKTKQDKTKSKQLKKHSMSFDTLILDWSDIFL